MEEQKTEKVEEVAKQQEVTEPVEDKTDIIAEARQVRDENKKLLEQLKEERKKIERATAEIVMSGKSHAVQTIKPKEETPTEYKERVMRGEVDRR